MNKEIHVGLEYYFIYYTNRNKLPGGQFNLDNYEVLKGRVVDIKDKVIVETGELGILELSNTSFFKEYSDAENYRIHLNFL